jgi:hypothetical protein
VFRREGQHRAEARLFLLRGGVWSTIDCEDAHERGGVGDAIGCRTEAGNDEGRRRPPQLADRQMEMGENAVYLLDDARGIAANMIVGSQPPRGNKGGG